MSASKVRFPPVCDWLAALGRAVSRSVGARRESGQLRENRGLTFRHEDDGTAVLHGRFALKMGARILGALDAAMAAHAKEQPPTGSVVRRGGRELHRPAESGDLRAKRSNRPPGRRTTSCGKRPPT